ncbi:MAG TPA: 2-amino-4-hydroxy-6-hydroxymethyldihydropteridine diphosphokinase [Bacteroidales bacterium]|nr:2-amino-4-hydroxy-6-hydroxymethyldihydropteridine diphosphokinase [Bacteroidales bacterium]
MAKVYFVIGGNLGDREQYIDRTKCLISERVGYILRYSSLYESEPWGFDNGHNFLNQVIIVDTQLSPAAILLEISFIEGVLGRERNGNGFSARTADIDILFYDQQIMLSPSLVIPHRFLHKRMFVLTPLSEVAPDFIHPLFSVTVRELLASCDDKTKVWKYQSVEVAQ